MRLPLLLGVAAVAMSSAAHADQVVIIFGTGLKSCAQFVALAETSPLGESLQMPRDGLTYRSEKYAAMEWVLGYLSQANAAESSAHQISLDNEAIELWLKNYCTAHPTDLLAGATRNLVRFMHKKT